MGQVLSWSLLVYFDVGHVIRGKDLFKDLAGLRFERLLGLEPALGVRVLHLLLKGMRIELAGSCCCLVMRGNGAAASCHSGTGVMVDENSLGRGRARE